MDFGRSRNRGLRFKRNSKWQSHFLLTCLLNVSAMSGSLNPLASKLIFFLKANNPKQNIISVIPKNRRKVVVIVTNFSNSLAKIKMSNHIIPIARNALYLRASRSILIL